MIFSMILILFGCYMVYETLDLGQGDYKLFCIASDAFINGDNPYDMVGIGLPFPYRYPPVTLYVFELFCNFHSLFVYSMMLMMMILLILLMYEKNDTLYLLALILTGFNTVFFSLANGQIGILDGLFMTIIIFCIIKKYYVPATFLFAPMALFKTVPIAFASLLLIIKELRIMKRILLVVLSIISLFLLHVLQLVFLQKSYFQYFDFTFLSQYPIIDRGGEINPALYNIVGHNLFVYGFFVIIIVLFYLYFVHRTDDTIKRFNYGVLCVALTLPELKWYSLCIVLTSVYLLTREFDYYKKFITLIIVCVIPIICKVLIVSNNWMFLEYYQYFTLLVFVVWYYFNRLDVAAYSP